MSSASAVVPVPEPDRVLVQTGVHDQLRSASRAGDRWSAAGTDITTTEVTATGFTATGDTATGLTVTGDTARGLAVGLRSGTEVSRVVLRWTRQLPADLLVVGDAWERSYGDLAWQHLQPERVLPWYWTGWSAQTGQSFGAGVDVRPSAFAFWTVDREGISLWLDVRNGGSGVRPADREISLATVRWVVSDDHEPVAVQRDLVAALSATITPRSPGPLVGANNWYYAYGVGFDADAVRADARTVVELADGHPVRPFSVIDDGWNPGGPGSGGPWTEGTSGIFGDMAELAAEIGSIGARPGLWFRPLRSRDEADRSLALPRTEHDQDVTLDPSRPEVLERVADDLRRFRGWGYELIKHDFSTFDIFGRFGPAMGAELTDPGWSFADRSRTNAEIINAFYDTIRGAAGDAVLLGCNTVGHLCAGVVDAQRTGDDTSGRQWERTRRMGVNTLAHRLVQHRRFFSLDADCVPCTPHVPWQLSRQFLDLVARSGTALFVSVDPRTRSDRTDADLAAALRIALDGGTAATDVQAIDARYATTPTDWRFGELERHYDWSEPYGAFPLPE